MTKGHLKGSKISFEAVVKNIPGKIMLNIKYTNIKMWEAIRYKKQNFVKTFTNGGREILFNNTPPFSLETARGPV